MADLLSQEIWAPMGAQEDAYIVVDDSGFGLARGGMCVTLRDFGRFAQLMTQGGVLSIWPAGRADVTSDCHEA